MWWGGFLLCGLLLILVAIPFFSFPKVLTVEREKIRLGEKAAAATCGSSAPKPSPNSNMSGGDTGYGKDIKGMQQICSSIIAFVKDLLFLTVKIIFSQIFLCQCGVWCAIRFMLLLALVLAWNS